MDYSKHSREELLAEIKRLESHVLQLRNVIAKQGSETPQGKRKSRKAAREFDFTLYKKRKVLFQVAYFGWNYHGFAVQEDSPQTIEGYLFKALTTTRLIESRETSNYHRCGRTDKGVSAFRQVISIEVRSQLQEGDGVFDYPGCKADSRSSAFSTEIEYCKILNSNLPPDIQVLAWCPLLSRDFSARFDCKMREYKYIFPYGSMQSLERMNEAGAKLVGSHDFRNFCKMDVNNGVVAYIRKMKEVVASPMYGNKDIQPYDLCSLKVVGNAFLWHQIRCIVTVLFHIGEGLEEPTLIDELLDVEKHPRRPQYGLASEIPLNLFEVTYEDSLHPWVYEADSLKTSLKGFQAIWTEHAVKAEMIRTCAREIEKMLPEEEDPPRNQARSLLPHSKQRIYTPFLDMLKCPSLEEKIVTAKKRKKNIECE